MRRAVAIMFGFVLLWGFFQQAGKEPQTYYRLFLLLCFPTLLALFRLPPVWTARRELVLIFSCGPLLLVGYLVSASLEGRGFIVLLVGWMAWFLTLTLSYERDGASRALLMFVVLIGGGEAVVGLAQALGGNEIATGTFTNRNHFAGLLNMALLMGLGGLAASYAQAKAKLSSEVYARAWLVILNSAFMGLGILLSVSRMGVVALFLSIVFVAILLFVQPGHAGRVLPMKAAVVLLVVIAGLGFWVGVDSLITRFEYMDDLQTRRLVVYQDTIEMISERPWIGVGPGMYEWRFRPYQTGDPRLWFRHAHNDYLETAVEWGIPLAGFFWIFVIWRLWRSIQVFLGQGDPWQRGIALGCAGAIFSILIHSLADFNLQIPLNWAVFCMVLGISQSNESSVNRHPSAAIRRPVASCDIGVESADSGMI